MNQKDLAKSLEELESVPSGMFHFALEDKSNFFSHFNFLNRIKFFFLELQGDLKDFLRNL